MNDFKKFDVQRRKMNRRKFIIAGVGATSGLLLSSQFAALAQAQDDYPPMGNYPLKDGKVVFGILTPQTGPYSPEGKDELRGYKLAIKHINEGGGGIFETMKPLALKGNGILGKKVSYVTGDTKTNPDTARDLGRRMIERDSVIMFTGGSNSAAVVAQQYLAQEKGVIYMSAMGGSNAITGKDRRRFAFRQLFPSLQIGMALPQVLAKEYGKDRRTIYLTADYTWGHTTTESMKKYTEKQGWTTVRDITVSVGTTDYSQYLTSVLNSDADVLILSLFGQDAITALTQAVRFGLKKRKVNGRQLQIVVPLFDLQIAQGIGSENLENVYGTIQFYHELKTPGAQAFTKAYMDEYQTAPGDPGHLAYLQTILYADAVERAGTFYPPAVIKALEGFEFNGAGLGPTTYRACDHQGLHRILVVRGHGPSEMKDEFDLFDVVGIVPREDLIYPCDLFPGELGPYQPAA